MNVDLSKLVGAFVLHDGLPRPQWPVIYDWIDANVDANEHASAWRAVAQQWLLHLAGELHPEYGVCESPNILFLSRMIDNELRPVMQHAEAALRAIERMPPDVVVSDGFGPRVIMLLDTHEDYVTYISHYYPDGHFAASAGCFLKEGYRHIAVCATARWHLLETITHELAHACLSCIQLPLWLDEGVVDVVTESVHPTRQVPMTAELRQRHIRYWSRHGLDEFWTGRSFSSPRGQELSYSLARVLVHNLLADHRRRFQRFLKDADEQDFGAGALAEHLGLTLSKCAATFLGEGDWAPGDASADPLPPAHVRPQRRGNRH